MAEDNDHNSRIAVFESEIRWLKENIALQAREYERRLSELNHAHVQAEMDRGRFVNSDIFYSKMDELYKWRNDVDTWRAKVVGIAIGVGAVSGGVAGVIAGAFK